MGAIGTAAFGWPDLAGTIAAALLLRCKFVAQRFGLVTRIANGNRALACTLIALKLIPSLTIGDYRLYKHRPAPLEVS